MLPNRMMQRESNSQLTADAQPSEPLFDTLSNSRRRAVIDTLDSELDVISLSELVDRVSEVENEANINEISSKERNRVYTSLYQTHLPHLDEKGVVNYDESEKRVSTTDETEFARLLLQISNNPETLNTEHQERWNDYFVGTAGVCTVFSAASLLTGFLAPFAILNTILTAGIFILLLLAVIGYIVSCKFAQSPDQ